MSVSFENHIYSTQNSYKCRLVLPSTQTPICVSRYMRRERRRLSLKERHCLTNAVKAAEMQLGYHFRTQAQRRLRTERTAGVALARLQHLSFGFRNAAFFIFPFRSHCNSQPIPVQSRTKFRCSSAIPFAHAHFLPSMVSPSLHATAAERPGKAFPSDQVRDETRKAADRRHVGVERDTG